jgi:hypothetical protein
MSDSIALDCIANAVELQTEVLCSMVMRVQILEAQVEQMQQTAGRNKRRAFRVMSHGLYKVSP